MAASLEERILKAIVDDPEIRESNISVTVKGKGLFRKGEIHLFGNVSRESEKKRAQEIAEFHGQGMKVVNEIVVTR
ncbi:MAG: BON domain-containing protein [bacterium]